MPKAYFIAQVTVTDPDAYARYSAATRGAAEKFGGRAIVRAGRMEVLEGHGRPRVVVLEFDSLDEARGYYTSPEYQAARQHRIGAAEFDAVIVEGVE